MGLGAFFTFKGSRGKIRRHRIGIEFNYLMLFTDYIDDVSTSYPHPDAVEEGAARDLYYRTWELQEGQENPATRNYPRQGGQRGNPEVNDGFSSITISYSYVLRTNNYGRYRPKYNYIYGNTIRSKRKKNW